MGIKTARGCKINRGPDIADHLHRRPDLLISNHPLDDLSVSVPEALNRCPTKNDAHTLGGDVIHRLGIFSGDGVIGGLGANPQRHSHH